MIIIVSVLSLAWIMPQLLHLAVDSPSRGGFVYYSSIEKAFVTMEFDEVKEKLIRYNLKTNKEYTSSELDSVLPMFYYRQLLSESRMPKEIHGVPIDVKQIRSKSFFYRMSPYNKNKPSVPLYTLFESISGRVNLQPPGDFFRLTDKIEFLNPESNSVIKEKSRKFNYVFNARNFKFPAKIVAGNPSERKPYDEGYFILDSNNEIFHLKMVNGKPFLKNINMPENIKPVFIEVQEPKDHSFYAFVFDENNDLYIITTNNYAFQKITCPKFNIDKDKLKIMTNPLYWNIEVKTENKKEYFAIDAKTKKLVDKHSFSIQKKESVLLKYLFPFTIQFESSNTRFIISKINFSNYYSILINVIFALIFMIISKIKKQKYKLIPYVVILITGIYGFITMLIFNNEQI